MHSDTKTRSTSTQQSLVKAPLLYHQLKLSQKPAEFFDDLANNFGDFVQYRGAFSFYFINHPDLVKQVLKGTNSLFDKNTVLYDRFRNVFGDGLVTAEGEVWKKQRQLIQPIFAPSAVKMFFDIMLSSAERMADRWQDYAKKQTTFNVANEMNQLTLEIAGRTLFHDGFNEVSHKIGDWTHTINHYSAQPPLPIVSQLWFPSPTNLKLNKVMREFHQFLSEMISKRKNHDGPTDLLTILLNAKNEAGEPMSEFQLMKEVLGMIVGGHETSSCALTWIWYQLCKNPDIEAKLHDELQEVLGGRTPTLQDIPKLKYTRMIIDEATRLHPPFWFENRNTKEDVEMWGHTIPKGSTIAFSRYSLHRHPDFWENPDKFDPERFDSSNEKNKRPSYAHVPFGGGPRVCIGINFAIMELVVILATLAQRHRLNLHSSDKHVMQAQLTMEPKHGVSVQAIAR